MFKNYFLSITFCFYGLTSRDINSTDIKVAFWNVENLFDLDNDPLTNDDEYATGGRKNVTEDVYELKLNNLSEILNKLDAEILGLCEVENRFVLEELNNAINRNYNIIHYDSPDNRGIDVALLYDSQDIILKSSDPIKVILPSGSPTRDILYTNFLIHGSNLHIYVNHWPSKYGGVEKTIPFRAAAAKILRNDIEKILKLDPKAEIIVMGDLNDEPTDASVHTHLGASLNKDQLTSKDIILWNLMGPWHRNNNGSTYKYAGQDLVYDHLIISPGLIDKSGLYLKENSVDVFDGKQYRQHGGKYDGYPFRFWAGNRLLGGYSDHMPISLIIKNIK